MLVAPSKILKNKIVKNRTLFFETPTRTQGNMVIIPSLDKDAIYSTIKSNLFKPMQLLALYSPRKIKPIGRSQIIVNQKDEYVEAKIKTNGRIKRGKTSLSSYGGQNLVYDIFNEYKMNIEALSMRKQKLALQTAVYDVFKSSINTASSNSDYTDLFLVFPLTKYFDNPARIFNSSTDYDTLDPLALFIRDLNKGKVPAEFKKIKLVIFYVPKSDILMAIDIHDKNFLNDWNEIRNKLKRMNAFINGTDDLQDEIIEGENELIDDSVRLENKKEELKNLMFSKVAKTIRANNLTDFEAATRDEKDLMVAIDKKVDDYLKKPENLQKTIPDLVAEIETDNEIKSKAIRYVETKKASIIRADTLTKGLEKETDIIGSLQDLDYDGETNIADNFNIDVAYIDDRIKTSRLSSFDEEYNKKQAMKDLTNVVSNFSNNEYSPLTVDSINIVDSDTDVDDKKTMHVRYKTDDGKSLSFQVDIPKIVDKRYLYLGGNKKVIKKQLIRLPIVKTKSDRVEITTNYNKITVERTNGKLSRKNAYILKKLKEIKENPGFEIEYGDNSVVNAQMGYSNDFEYEELASSINKIKTGKYTLLFNRDYMRDEIDTLDIPENFIDRDKTPLGFETVGETFKALIFIQNRKILKYNIEGKNIEEVSNSLFEFLTEDVLKLDMSILPSIGKSFIYTKMKFLATTYPMFPVIASQKGITNILKRYNVEYYIREKQEKNNVEYVGVKFKDCYLYYKDEMRNTLLLNSLYLMNPEEYNYSDFDADIPYTRYFMDTYGDSVGIHIRNTLRINFQVVIDPITRDILLDLKQPTDIIDVLLYANTLLVGNQYKPQNDMTNYRLRSNELVADRLYCMLADAYVNYCKHKINGKPINLVVPKGGLISALLQEPNINDKSTLNPVIEAEQIAQASAKGFRRS